VTAATYEDARSESDERTPITGVGRLSALALAVALVVLKLSELGETLNWEYATSYPFVRNIEWADQWRSIAIIALEGAAGAAAISIAFSIFVSNTFTTNISQKIVRKVKNAVNEETRSDVASIRKDVAEFRELLATKQANPDDLRLLNQFLEFARDNKISELQEKLRNDDELINRLASALSDAVRDLRERPPSD
jgi:hypothetical protein